MRELFDDLQSTAVLRTLAVRAGSLNEIQNVPRRASAIGQLISAILDYSTTLLLRAGGKPHEAELQYVTVG